MGHGLNQAENNETNQQHPMFHASGYGLPYLGFCETYRENISIAPDGEGCMMESNLTILVVLLLISTGFAGCTSEETEELKVFPQFSSVADDNETYNKAKMAGSPYIVMFSAEWCNNPCHTSMFTIWEALPELPVLVMSTDPAENASGITLQDWHESANAFDDESGDTGVTLTTYAFMKGVEPGLELDITSPGTVMFVNAEGYITATKVGMLEEPQEVLDLWETAQ